MPKLTFATIFFEEDVAIMRLQARSLARFLPAETPVQILLVFNGDPSLLQPEIRHGLLDLYGPHQSKVQIVFPEDLGWIEGESVKGWRKQQVLKLLTARLAVSEQMVILDSKNHFLAPVGPEDFFQAAGRPKNFFSRKYGTQLEWVRNSLDFFGNDRGISEVEIPPTITPYAIRRQTILDMLKEIDRREGSLQNLFMRNDFRGTEFYLLFSFLQSTCATWDFTFFARTSAPATLFSSWPKDAADIDRVVSRAESGQTKCFGLHMRREVLLSPQIWGRIVDLWNRCGIFDVEAARFYADRVVAQSTTSR